MHSIMRVSLVFVVIIPLLFFPRLFFGWFTSFNWVHCSMLLRSCCYNSTLTSVDPSFFPSKNILFPPIVVPCMNYIHHKACTQKHFALTWIINFHVPFGFVEWVVCLLAWWWPSWHWLQTTSGHWLLTDYCLFNAFALTIIRIDCVKRLLDVAAGKAPGLQKAHLPCALTLILRHFITKPFAAGITS